MNTDDFLNVLSQDDGVRTLAEKNVMEFLRKSSSIDDLLKFVDDDGIKQNRLLYRSILIHFCNYVRYNKEYFICLMNDDVFKTRLIRLIFSLDAEDRCLIENIFTIGASSNPDSCKNLYISLFDMINNTTELENIYTILNLTYCWLQKSQSADVTATFQEFISSFFSHELDITDTMIQRIVSVCSKIIGLITLKNVIAVGEIIEIIIKFFTGLVSQLNSQDNNILSLKCDILSMFCVMIKFIYQDIKSDDESSLEIVEAFQGSCIPYITTCLSCVLESFMSDSIIDYVMNILYLYLLYKIDEDVVFQIDLFANFVIPCAKLRQTDLDDFADNPDFYVSTIYLNDYGDHVSSRHYAYKFVQELVTSHKNSFDPLQIIVGDLNESDELLLEAQVYLISAISEKVELPSGIYQGLFELMNKEIPDYLLVALLKLTNVCYDNPTVSSMLASFYILQCDDPVIEFAAVDLLNKCISSLGDENITKLRGIIDLPVSDLVQKILEISSILSDPLPITTLSKLFIFSEDQNIGIVLTEHFLENISKNINTTKSETDVSNVIKSLIEIICCLPNKSVGQIAPKIIQSIMEFLANLKSKHDMAIVEHLLDLISYIVLRKPSFVFSSDFIIKLDTIVEIITSNSLSDVSISSLPYILCPVILTNGMNFLSHTDLVSRIISLIKSALDPENEAGAENISAALFISTCLIIIDSSYQKVLIPSITNMIVAYTNDPNLVEDDNLVFLGVFYVFGSSFIINEEDTMKFFTSDLAHYLVSKTFTGLIGFRDIHFIMTTKLFLQKHGIEGGFTAADNLSPMYFDMKNDEEKRIHTCKTLRENEIFYIKESVTTLYPLIEVPTQNFKLLTLHRTVAEAQPI